MADIEGDGQNMLHAALRNAQQSRHVQTMLMAAGLAAFGIVAVATAMLTRVL